MEVNLSGQDAHGLLQRLHPVTALVYLGVLGGLTLVMVHPLYLLGLLIITLLILQAVNGFKGWELCLKITLGMGLLIFLLNVLVVQAGETVLWQSPRLPFFGTLMVSLEALSYASAMCMRLLAILTVFYLLNRMLHPDQILRLFSRFAARSALILSLSTRMFPFLLREARTLKEILLLRGVDFQKGSYLERLHKYLALFNLLLLNTLENALETAEAMQARAFASGPRTHYKRQAWRPRDFFCMGACFFAALTAAYGYVYQYSTFSFYPRLGYLLAHPLTLWHLIFLFIFLLLPISLSWGWKYCPYLKAKI